MGQSNPWKTPFGKLLIGASIIAATVGFSLAAGVAGYFRASPATDEQLQVADLEEANSIEISPSGAEEYEVGEDTIEPVTLADAIESLPAADGDETVRPETTYSATESEEPGSLSGGQPDAGDAPVSSEIEPTEDSL